MSVEPERHHGPPSRATHPVKSDNYQRASDAERHAVVEQLQLNCSEGRITMEEFEERTERALKARTGGELRGVMSDLPVMRVPPPPEVKARRKRAARSAVVVPYLVINVFLIFVWMATGFGYFWPIWIILGWGLGVVFALLAIGRSDGQRWP